MTTRAEAIERAALAQRLRWYRARLSVDHAYLSEPPKTPDGHNIIADLVLAAEALALPPDPVPGAGVELETVAWLSDDGRVAKSASGFLDDSIGYMPAWVEPLCRHSDFAKLQAELARLRPLADEAGRLREALDTIAGGWINRFPGAPNIMKVSPTDFQHGMWSWSQAVAKAALSPAQSQETKP